MGEWYRGIAPGGPGPVASDVHDLGPGAYFTDDLAVAKGYAKFRADDSNRAMTQRTVYPAVLYGNFSEPSLGPVLDLTSGADGEAWREFEETSYIGVTNRAIMKSNPERYGPMFKEWATKRGLNLNQYAAIIGPEYLRGGRQLCIRNPSVADRVMSSMVGRGVDAPPPQSIPAQTITVNTYSARGQANGAALVAVFMVVDGLANYLNGMFREAEVRGQVQGDMRHIREWQKTRPWDGALIVITFSRKVLSSEFMQKRIFMQPGDAFEDSSVYYAPTIEEAVKKWSKEVACVNRDIPDGPYATLRRDQLIWVGPRGPQTEVVLFSPVGNWTVKIGDWKGRFAFSPGNACAWSEAGGPPHNGTWKVVGNEAQWTYRDDPPGWQRIFHARLPLKSKVNGDITINGVNHGYYEMTKTT
jgi:hypothetical protein